AASALAGRIADARPLVERAGGPGAHVAEGGRPRPGSWGAEKRRAPPPAPPHQIIPARYLKGTSKDGLGEGLFADWRYDGDGNPRDGFVLNRPEMAGRAVLLAGANFGSGSSREHAAWALRAFGIRAV